MKTGQVDNNLSDMTHETGLRAYRELQRDYWVAHAHRSTSGHALAESLSHAFDRLQRAGCPSAAIEEAARRAKLEGLNAGAGDDGSGDPPAGDRFEPMQMANEPCSRKQEATLHNAIWDLGQAVAALAAIEPKPAGSLLRDTDRETLEALANHLQQWVARAKPVRD